jgi:hypothetical protein
VREKTSDRGQEIKREKKERGRDREGENEKE